MASILIVDDEPDIRLMLRMALSIDPHRFLEAAHGQEALDVLEREAVDLMVLDVMMPILDGFGVLERLRERPTTPVVVVTGMQTVDDEHVAQLLELGALDVIQKPFNPDRVVEMIDAILKVDEEEREEYRRRRLALARGED